MDFLTGSLARMTAADAVAGSDTPEEDGTTSEPDQRLFREPPKQSAVLKVFGTVELLENILILTFEGTTFAETRSRDLRWLLCAHRVNHTCKETMTRSPRIQRALWFQQDPDAPSEAAGAHINPICFPDRNKNYMIPNFFCPPKGHGHESWRKMLAARIYDGEDFIEVSDQKETSGQHNTVYCDDTTTLDYVVRAYAAKVGGRWGVKI
ncbi:hypothetical protein Slin15195_G110480 [Septoria linicola]|uniref:Uncharacterized protein n=1 Tax=Septoria linicola TaxID=215465 RepID=A0A9Q9AYY0_9PEZI|nr:hypothetical protein Slin15195_G110480 [Septoria linicola]